MRSPADGAKADGNKADGNKADGNKADSAVAGGSSGFGHGKLILLGEHAVVFGAVALAAGIPRGVRAVANPGQGHVRVPAWAIDARLDDGSMVATAATRLLAALGVGRLDFAVDAGIPARAGLGSSAALAVAMARAAATAGTDDATLLAAVGEAEAVFHGSPSGIDAAAALCGGVGRFRKGEGWRPVPVRRRIRLCVGLSGRPRDTRAQVEAVGRLCARTPVARRFIDALSEAAEAGIEALALGDIDALGRLFDLAHGALAGLGVSSPELDTLVHAARAVGAIGAKLTGAGGGGAVIALAPSHTEDVLERWRSLGFEGFVTEVGGDA
jgi:mevalonate kinase